MTFFERMAGFAWMAWLLFPTAKVMAFPSEYSQSIASAVSADDACKAGTCTLSALQIGSDLLMQRRALLSQKPNVTGNYWPHSRGPVPGQFGFTEEVGPEDLKEHLSWTWHHEHGPYATVVAGGPVIDSNKNVYLTNTDGVRKFSSDGDTLWHYKPPFKINNMPTLLDEIVLGNDEGGHAFALNMTTGEPIWEKRYGNSSGLDSGYPAAYKGTFIMGLDLGHRPPVEGGNERVVALNASTGDFLWEYRTEAPVWNFMPIFLPDENSVIFMDDSGGAYRLSLDGKQIWHNPPPEDSRHSFSDGGLMLGQNGVAYTCSNTGNTTGSEGGTGMVRAIEMEDGRTRWTKLLPHPCNNYPTVGRVNEKGLSVIVNTGSFPGSPLAEKSPHHGGVFVFDAETGALQWQYQEPVYMEPAARGDSEGFKQRMLMNSPHVVCLPAPWSSPTVDGSGAIYLGHMSGLLHVLRGPAAGSFEKDEKALSEMEPETTPGVQVYSMDLGAGYLHGGTAWAPGMMAVATCDTLHVFKF
mmetsp:Transcript_15392/g.26933  ORF Transcript_15392/g.26933 Transcript_15392/m.26933 type:complete len:523 (-) Transcript_15392:197-1765(-)